MSIVDNLAKSGAGIKNLAIGAAILTGIGLIYWLYKKSGVVAQKVEQGAGFVFGTSNDSSLGTYVYDVFHGDDAAPFQDDEDQAVKTCNALWAKNGDLKGPVCTRLRSEGKLTAPPQPKYPQGYV